MKEAKNELLQFVAGIIMLFVGLYILSEKVMVTSTFGFYSMWGGHLSSGLIMVPLIIGIVWMFVSGGSFASKVFSAFAVLLIIVAIILTTRIWLVSMSMYQWVLILVLIFGGAGLVGKVLFAGSASSIRGEKRKKGHSDEAIDRVSDTVNSIDKELENMKRNM